MIQITPHPVCLRLAESVRQAGGRALLVGGWVRDAVLGLDSKDLDVEVFGLPADRLEALLRSIAPIDQVGRAFAVFKLKGLPVDVSMPRRESKQGLGHRGFRVEGDPSMTLQEAAARRDFTINAMAWDPLEKTILDPTGGLADLQSRRLRHVSPQFVEDPLRVLRGMQLVARFELVADPATLALCQSISPEGLPRERIFEEWKKWLLRGVSLSAGLNFLADTGWVRHFPELEALIGCPQDPEWHPEGDAWVHTGHCLDAFARERTGDPWEDLIVGLAVLCHDLGKPLTTVVGEDGRIRSPRHDIEGVEPTRQFLQRLTQERAIAAEVLPLVEAHMRPNALYKTKAGDQAVRRLARTVGRMGRLLRVVQADLGGRPPLPAESPSIDWLRQRVEALAVADAAPRPILQGRHLINEGIPAGPQIGTILSAAYEAQLDGAFHDLSGALQWFRSTSDD